MCFIDEWNLIDKAEHHWTINVPCVFDGVGMAINPVAGEFSYTSQISSYGDIHTCLRETSVIGTSYSELQWTVDGDNMYVIETSGSMTMISTTGRCYMSISTQAFSITRWK